MRSALSRSAVVSAAGDGEGTEKRHGAARALAARALADLGAGRRSVSEYLSAVANGAWARGLSADDDNDDAGLGVDASVGVGDVEARDSRVAQRRVVFELLTLQKERVLVSVHGVDVDVGAEARVHDAQAPYRRSEGSGLVGQSKHNIGIQNCGASVSVAIAVHTSAIALVVASSSGLQRVPHRNHSLSGHSSARNASFRSVGQCYHRRRLCIDLNSL